MLYRDGKGHRNKSRALLLLFLKLLMFISFTFKVPKI